MKRWIVLFAVIAALAFAVPFVNADIVGNWITGLGGWSYMNGAETVNVTCPVFIADDFVHKAVDTTYTWNFQGDNSGAVALTTGSGGIARLTTGTSDDNADQLTSPLAFLASKYSGVEVRAACNDVTHTAFCLGFSDATAESAGYIATTFNNTGAIITAADFVGFVFDVDQTTTVLNAVAVKAGVSTLEKALSNTVSNGEYHVYRVQFTSTDGNVDLYVDGQCVGGVTASTTITTPLCTYIGFQNREGAANTFDVDYVRAWQGR